MAQCKQNAQEFVQNTFNPHVAVLCSADAEVLCQKNNLTFVELVQPFCRLTSEGDHIFIIENSVTDILYCTIAGMVARMWLILFYLNCKTSKKWADRLAISESSSLSLCNIQMNFALYWITSICYTYHDKCFNISHY